MSEKNLQDFLLKKCKKFNILAYKTEAKGCRGFPDVTVCHDGAVYFIELKNPNGKGRLSVQQIDLITEMKKRGIKVHVYNSKEHVEQFIDSLLFPYGRPV